jgi:hypothetical protein
MNKLQASNIVKNTFENPFDKTVFISFVKNLLNHIEEAPFINKGNYIYDSFKEYIASFERIGKYSDGEHKIDILIVHLKKETSIERARTMQRNYIAKHLNGGRGGELKDAALVAFVSPNTEDWRFSLVKMDYKFENTASGKIKVKEEFTPARRWSFLVGTHENSHTAQSRFVPLITDDTHNPTLAELEDAFNIEKVTKEFFIKYRDLFIRTKESLDKVLKTDSKVKVDFEKKGVNTVDFSKKLLGQIVFLYFLQKKGWFGVSRDGAWGTGPKNFIRDLFSKKHGDYKNFFNDILEPLFYEALATERKDNYYSRFECKIPFLNGGLFDPIGNYDWVHTDIRLPDELFSNSKKTSEGDVGDGILDIFDRFNFTVKEDEPLEKEVAIDPELLGKAYEKFNAIRPDNYAEFKKALKSGKKGGESKFNKQYGVYYTPREIVHYMCQQSLINYLYTELNDGIITYEKLVDEQTDMFGNEGKTGQLDLTIERNSKPVIPKEDIETLVHFGEHLSENETHVEKLAKETETYYYKLPDSIRNNAEKIDKKLADIKVCDPAVGSGAFPVGMMSEIVRVRNALSPFIKDGNRSVYHFKRECIENSLYGVDIDPGAVEIAKLRLWLSLVVDEDDIKQIKPLPNLDYKIICGNSLLGVEKNLFNSKLFEELETVKHLYFNETNLTKKEEYKKQIDGLISQITYGHSEFDFEIFFSEVFHEKGGFDVVIGNPPYGADFKNHERNIYKTIYQYRDKDINSFVLFIEKSSALLANKSTLCFIVPKNFIKTDDYENIRKFSLDNFNIISILDCGKAFDDVTGEMISFLFNKPKQPNFLTSCLIYDDTIKISAMILQNEFEKLDKYRFNIFLNKQNLSLINKIKNKSQPLSELVDIYRGIETGKKDNFISDTIPKGKYKLIVAGKDVDKYRITNIRYIQYKPELINFKDENMYNVPKILIRKIASNIHATYDNKKLYTTQGVYLLLPKPNTNLYYILAIINSNLIHWYYELYFNMGSNLTTNVTIENLKNIPIRLANDKIINSFKSIVEKILTITESDDYINNKKMQKKVKEYENEIDRMVYKLYGLTDEEIKIVEGETNDN